jgi:PIN domain nuclease of toxin-antitoxin system
MGTRITLDAHTLIWFFHKESNGKLSRKALTTIKEAEASGIIYVPTVVLMEVMRIIEKRKYPVSFDEILQYIEENEAYKIVPLTTKIIKIIRNFQSRDLHDRVIIATALITDSVLVSKDKEIRAIGLNVIWSKNPDESIT